MWQLPRALLFLFDPCRVSLGLMQDFSHINHEQCDLKLNGCVDTVVVSPWSCLCTCLQQDRSFILFIPDHAKTFFSSRIFLSVLFFFFFSLCSFIHWHLFFTLFSLSLCGKTKHAEWEWENKTRGSPKSHLLLLFWKLFCFHEQNLSH